MPREFNRSQRLATQIQRELAALIHDELDDPRIGMVTLSDVELSRDLANAKVFVTFLAASAEQSELVKILNHAASFLRSRLGRKIRVRIVPHLRFIHDQSVERGARLSQLIDHALAEKPVSRDEPS